MEIEKKGWEDLSISQFIRLKNTMEFKCNSITKSIEMLSVIYDKDPEYFKTEIDVDSLEAYLEALNVMLSTQIPIVFDEFGEYEVMGSIWQLTLLKKQMTAGQYISFKCAQEDNPDDIARLLAMVLIPKGGKFGYYPDNTAYDIEQLIITLNTEFPYCKAKGIANFFLQASITSKIFTLRSSVKKLKTQMKKARMEHQKETISKAIEEINETIKILEDQTKNPC